MIHATVPHLFASWNEIAARLKRARLIALFLDFDGTLAPLHRRPEDVHLGPNMRSVIRSLRANPRFRVCVISGRRRADVRERMRVAGIRYLGLHGWEDIGGAVVRDEVRQLLVCLKGRFHMRHSWVEDKGVSITIHHDADATPGEISRVRESVAREIEHLGQHLRILAGARSWEVMPVDWKDKGGAVLRELSSMPRQVLPIYLGDEPADEPAFAVLRDGITVRVGAPSPTRARYRLSNVAQVRGCLERIQKETA
jgi:trehalose 6-phosphate phosphatase